MKEYVTPIMELHIFTVQDIVTESNPYDNDYEDMDNWD